MTFKWFQEKNIIWKYSKLSYNPVFEIQSAIIVFDTKINPLSCKSLDTNCGNPIVSKSCTHVEGFREKEFRENVKPKECDIRFTHTNEWGTTPSS